MLITLFSILFTIGLSVGIVVLAVFMFRYNSNKVLDSTKYKYLQMAGTDGEATILTLTDTGRTLADVYCVYNAEIEITSVNPPVKTKTEATFLKSRILAVGNSVKVKYDASNPKVAKIVV